MISYLTFSRRMAERSSVVLSRSLWNTDSHSHSALRQYSRAANKPRNDAAAADSVILA